MSKSKFIQMIQEAFGIEEEVETSKRKAIKELLTKLKAKKDELKESLKHVEEKEAKDEIKESIVILKKQIKKGEKLLED